MLATRARRNSRLRGELRRDLDPAGKRNGAVIPSRLKFSARFADETPKDHGNGGLPSTIGIAEGNSG
jgi:hypothetical protein